MNSNNKKGLSTEQANLLQQQFGYNELSQANDPGFLKKILHILKEPMFLLLLLAAIVYFILGEPRDGLVMLVFVVGMIGIDFIQEWKTDKTLAALKDLSAPQITVLRDGVETIIPSRDLVVKDVMYVMEGVKIPADGVILECHDFCVDESTLTGEAQGVWKHSEHEQSVCDAYWRLDYVYSGTQVIQGSAVVLVDKIGKNSEYGKIGQHISESKPEPSPLQKQTAGLVKTCACIALLLMVIVSLITWMNLSDHEFAARLIESILSGITLAMAMIPEEFPVILTVFLSMGAWRLAKQHSLIRQLPSVETLGAVSVLCVDKTGTLTKNQMKVQELIAEDKDRLMNVMGMACECDAYDPMEHAILSCCEEHGLTKEILFQGTFLSEYSFTNELKMMGHIWQLDDHIEITAKGSFERFLPLCDLDDHLQIWWTEKMRELSSRGLRVLAVGSMKLTAEQHIPESITDCLFHFDGLIGLIDPLREGIPQDIEACQSAGIKVVMITGDHGMTASSIAKQAGIQRCNRIITGDEIEQMSDDELCSAVKEVCVFSRVLPKHKMQIVKAFKANGDVVAMTGDGVNDAPALKYADIGIAMGKRGSEVSREAADLILLDDRFSTIVDTIRDGRRIYDNIRKAVGYVFSIHIPIAFASLMAPLLKVESSALFLLPLHVVLLELIIDPTCSILLERQPEEGDVMIRSPRNPQEPMLTKRLLIDSVLQGVSLCIISFGTYYTVLLTKYNAAEARSLGLAIMMLGSMFLVLENASVKESIWHTLHKVSHDRIMKLSLIIFLLFLIIIFYSPMHIFLKLYPLSFSEWVWCLFGSGTGILWFELVKAYRRRKHQSF